MVAKITHGSSIYGAVSYNFRKVTDRKAKVILANKMIMDRNNDPQKTFQKTLMSFEPYLSANRRTKKPVVHISLNPNPADKLSSEQMADIAGEYMEKMGYKDQPYIVYEHSDIDRKHVHIVTVNVDGNGSKISDSYEKIRSMKACRELETKYKLKKTPDIRDEEALCFLRKVDYGKGDVKRQIANAVKTLVHDYRFQSFGEFNALLSCYNINARQVRGERQGNLYHGIVYCAANEKGELQGNPIKSSKIGKSVGYGAIGRIMDRTKQQLKKEGFNFGEAKDIIRRAMAECAERDKLALELKKHNIDVIFRENEDGRIYGVTFVDHGRKMAYNGSRLGKEFSANAFERLFGGEGSGIAKEPASNGNNLPDREALPDMNGFGASVDVDEIFGVFYPAGGGYDPQEEEFARRARRTKKKGRRRRM